MKFLSAFVRISSGLLPVLMLMVLPALVQAQPGSGGPTPGATTAVPIDGGASLLLAAGGAYALRRLRRGKQAK